MADWKCPDCGLVLNFSDLCNSGGHNCLEQSEKKIEQLETQLAGCEKSLDSTNNAFKELEAENERLTNAIREALQFHHKSIAEVIAGHKQAEEWLKSAKDLTDGEKHKIFSIWLLEQALKG